jgi:NAD(P)-dependent dehydrogenase (short-subunit alcohol dehydrogenase family)
MPTVFITGANRGLGLEFAAQYAAEGWRVIATCRDVAAADDLKRFSGDLEICALDITMRAAVTDLAGELAGTAIDVLINNAGVLLDYGGRLGGIDHDAVAASFQVNAFAPLHVSECFADHVAGSEMKVMAAVSSHLGSIQNMGGGGYAYAASKAALNALMKCLAGDARARGIKVVLFHPGWARTRMGGQGAAVDPAASVAGMRAIIAGLRPEQSGSFLNYDGEALPW